MQISENFRAAIHDYNYFLEKKYPEKAILELVATRYSLNHFERSMLYRGVTTQEVAKGRKNKMITIEQLSNRTLHLDLFNVLFTIAAYLRGFPVYLANDGLLRDASESHGKGDWAVHLDKSLDLLVDFLKELTIQKAVIYIDNPLEYGLVISEKLSELSKSTILKIKIISDPSPDHLIRDAMDGIIATSDTTIIDRSVLPIFDLPAFCLQHAFNPIFIAL